MNIVNPLDFMNMKKGKDVKVVLKGDRVIEGKLIGFDLNLNLFLEVKADVKFVQGESIFWIT